VPFVSAVEHPPRYEAEVQIARIVDELVVAGDYVHVLRAVNVNASPFALRSWLTRAQDALVELSKLGEDWDGYGAPRIHAGSLIAALEFLRDIHPRGRLAPAVLPTGLGNVRLEWRTPGVAVDVEVFPDGRYEASLEDEAGEWEWQGETRGGVDPVLVHRIATLEHPLELAI
jgi:hypothetical protein